MIGMLETLWWRVTSLLKSRKRLEAENLALRHQVTVLCRSMPRRLRLRGTDRFLFVWLYRLWPGVLNSIAIVKPDTVVRWHRRGFKAFWRRKSRGHAGRPRLSKEIRWLIRELNRYPCRKLDPSGHTATNCGRSQSNKSEWVPLRIRRMASSVSSQIMSQSGSTWHSHSPLMSP